MNFLIYKTQRPRSVFTAFATHSSSVEKIQSEISMEYCLETIGGEIQVFVNKFKKLI